MPVPTKDSVLVPYCQNWDTRVTASPSTFSLTAGQAAVLHGYVQAYLDAYNAEQAAVASDMNLRLMISWVWTSCS